MGKIFCRAVTGNRHTEGVKAEPKAGWYGHVWQLVFLLVITAALFVAVEVKSGTPLDDVAAVWWQRLTG